MRHSYYIAVLLCGFALCTAIKSKAQSVSKDLATEIAVLFFDHMSATDYPAMYRNAFNIPKDAVQTNVWEEDGSNSMYVVNMPDSGWVLVSGDKRADPILASCKNGTFPAKEDMPPAMLALLESYVDEIKFIQDSCPYAETHPNWQAIANQSYFNAVQQQTSGVSQSSYTPGTKLLNRPGRGEVRWDQNGHSDYDYKLVDGGFKKSYKSEYSYNKYCPDWNTVTPERTILGCGAVAMGQILWYWQWPHTGLIPTQIDEKGNLSGPEELHIYNWNLMPSRLSPYSSTLAEADQVATLLRDCAYAMRTVFGENGSASNYDKARDAFVERFAYYDGIDIIRKFWLSDKKWNENLQGEINAGRPVFYEAHGEGDHAFVVDGYDNFGHYHINWGWGNDPNPETFYNLNDLIYTNEISGGQTKYDKRHRAIINIKPAPACGAADINGGNNYRVGQAGAVTVSNVTVPSGTTAVYYSGTSITLRPGFKATAGSHTHIAIQNFPCNGIAPASLDPIGLKSVYAEPETGGSTGLNLDYVQGTSIYPNPTDGALYVQTSREVARIELYGLSGEKLLESRETTLDLHGLQEGMYVLMVHFADGTVHSEKVIRNQ